MSKAALSTWISDSALSRPEAVRCVLTDHLRTKGYLPAAGEAQ